MHVSRSHPLEADIHDAGGGEKDPGLVSRFGLSQECCARNTEVDESQLFWARLPLDSTSFPPSCVLQRPAG